MQALQSGLGQTVKPQSATQTIPPHSPSRHPVQAFRSNLRWAAPAQRCLTIRAAAEDVIETTSKDLDSALSQVKTGVARLRGVRGSPYKFRRVLDQIRGRSYEDALKILEFIPYRAREDVLTTLLSAAANAKHNEGALKKKLLVYECFADDAGMYKRFQPRAKGRPFPIHVKKSHLTIKVVET